jgi:2-oxo-4-hydroxy-4-carboxy-5-ureidoimidazoline decarboxylase
LRPLTLAEVNGFGLPAFIATVGKVFEHAPWVAQRAYARQPFASVEALHRAMMDVVRAASTEEKSALLGAYPELANSGLEQLGEITRARLDAMFVASG